MTHPITQNILDRMYSAIRMREHILHNVTYYITLVCVVWSIATTLIVIKLDRDVQLREQVINQQELTIQSWTNNCRSVVVSK